MEGDLVDPGGPYKDSVINSQGDDKPLKYFDQRSNILSSALKRSLWLLHVIRFIM